MFIQWYFPSFPDQQTFHYDSDYWSNKEEYNLPGGETGFDQMETKLPTYWNTSFSKICLGMKIDQELRFIVINMEADSLYSLIADGKYRPTVLGRETWRSLIGPKASSQIYCNREGFNLYPLTAFWEFRAPKARIGFVTNNANNCNDVETRIGFGTGGPHDDTNTCGIVADRSHLDNGKQFIKAMGYILVQWRAKTVIIVRNNVNITKKNLKKECITQYTRTLTILTEYDIRWYITIVYAKQYSKALSTRNEGICSQRIIFGRT